MRDCQRPAIINGQRNADDPFFIGVTLLILKISAGFLSNIADSRRNALTLLPLLYPAAGNRPPRHIYPNHGQNTAADTTFRRNTDLIQPVPEPSYNPAIAISASTLPVFSLHSVTVCRCTGFTVISQYRPHFCQINGCGIHRTLTGIEINRLIRITV